MLEYGVKIHYISSIGFVYKGFARKPIRRIS